MSLATTYCRAAVGVQAPLVTVEVHLANGLPAFNIVGLPEKAVQESRDRVRSALLNAGFEFPSRRITVNLAPADLPKEGGRFDLAIALGVLSASGQVPDKHLANYEFVGELSLSAQVQPVRAVLPAAIAARDAGRALMLAQANVAEATLIDNGEVYAVEHLLQACAHLSGQQRLEAAIAEPRSTEQMSHLDLADVRGQAQAKRALEIAAAGAHNLLLIGPPGTGKSMLASRLPGVLPLLSEHDAVEAAVVRSVCGQTLCPDTWRQAPFRHPHHTASGAALVGGGSIPRPGEVSLAHRGILFLDELPEFDRRVLEVLREPMESGHITISRAARQAEFPARFQLIAAMNPCPCGNLGDPRKTCRCTPGQVARYQGKISGPLLDRIDLHIEVPAPSAKDIIAADAAEEESSASVLHRVCAARQRQLARQQCLNRELKGDDLHSHCTLGTTARTLVHQATERLGLSARAYHRLLRVARTVADLAGCERIDETHLAEAIGLRAKINQGGL